MDSPDRMAGPPAPLTDGPTWEGYPGETADEVAHLRAERLQTDPAAPYSATRYGPHAPIGWLLEIEARLAEATRKSRADVSTLTEAQEQILYEDVPDLIALVREQAAQIRTLMQQAAVHPETSRVDSRTKYLEDLWDELDARPDADPPGSTGEMAGQDDWWGRQLTGPFDPEPVLPEDRAEAGRRRVEATTGIWRNLPPDLLDSDV